MRKFDALDIDAVEQEAEEYSQSIPHDDSSVYVSPEGDFLTFAQIGFIGAKEPDMQVSLISEDVYEVDDVTYRPVDSLTS